MAFGKEQIKNFGLDDIEGSVAIFVIFRHHPITGLECLSSILVHKNLGVLVGRAFRSIGWIQNAWNHRSTIEKLIGFYFPWFAKIPSHVLRPP